MIKLLITLVLLLNTALAEAPRHKTRQNEVTDMFDKEIEDKSSLEQMIEDSKAQAEQGISNKESLKTLDLKENELEGKTSELNSINANSLESAGQTEKAKEENAYYDALEIDYTDPKVINHHKDMDKILSASDRLMGRLIEGLKEHGIDCKTVKGDKELEPELYLDVEKVEQKDTVYDQHICEELRNQYSCSDTLTMKCVNKGSGNFQAQTIRLAYNEMPDHWWGALYGTTPVYGLFSRSRGFVDFLGHSKFQSENHNQIREEAKSIIMKKTGAKNIEFPEQQIFVVQRREIFYHLDENGNNGPINGRWPAVDADGTIRFFYKVGQEENCTAWSEEWSEQCTLK